MITDLHTIVDETEEEYDLTMAVNAKSVWLGCKFAIRQMLTQEPVGGSRGRNVNIASIGGLVGLKMPALFTITSSRPKLLTAEATRASTAE